MKKNSVNTYVSISDARVITVANYVFTVLQWVSIVVLAIQSALAPLKAVSIHVSYRQVQVAFFVICFVAGEDAPKASGKGRSSGTGLPHIIELYQQLTQHGEDFDFSLSTSNDGSTISMMFLGYVNTIEETTGTRKISSDLKLKGNLCMQLFFLEAYSFYPVC